jgi:methionyl-tRNA formyltransferase
MDTGPVYLERRVPIDPDETSGMLLARLAPIGAAALLDVLAAIASGTAHATAQDHAAATHARLLTKADGAIDFTAAASAVAARIRGVDPWPGAQVLLRGQIAKIFGAQAEDAGGAPGSVLAIDAGGLHVACGDGAVVIREIQPPGKKRMAPSQLAIGRGIAVGDVLGKPETA